MDAHEAIQTDADHEWLAGMTDELTDGSGEASISMYNFLLTEIEKQHSSSTTANNNLTEREITVIKL